MKFKMTNTGTFLPLLLSLLSFMEKPFQIFIDRLKNERTEKISGAFSPSFFVKESDFEFPFPVEIQGETYLSEEHLVLHLSGSTKVKMRCAICNLFFEKELAFKDFYQTIPLSEIPHAIYDFTEDLREAFLIELPQFGECHGGKCPERAKIVPYTKESKDDTYYPFSNL